MTNPTIPETETPAIDTSKMSAGQRAAMELTEAAREQTSRSGLVADLFMGRFDAGRLLPFPEQTTEDRDQGDAFLERLGRILREQADPDEIDRTGEIPDDVIEALAGIGAFGIKVPTQYGGLGLSQTNYCRAAMLLGRHCGNLTALLGAPVHWRATASSPVRHGGTEEQIPAANGPGRNLGFRAD